MASIDEIEKSPCDHLDNPCVKAVLKQWVSPNTARLIWFLMKFLKCLFEGSSSEYQVEVSMSPLGCVKDEDGNLIGKVMATRTVDETTGENEWIKMFYPVTGEPPTVYQGEWTECEPNTEWEDGEC